MNTKRDEGAAIARLVGGRSNLTVGWVYLWNTLELGILWLRRDLTPERIEPPLDPEVLAMAKSVTTDEITALLDRLTASGTPK
ncbi:MULTISPECIES: hypothetical protein [Salipiger]|uniref:Uncharacterized protein n=1 Tax=Salipiger profundus TaxID=1229727 RepID=A0A1U7DDA4_9RHOB|nr:MULTISPECIES: hypothetical protein [Salipiger]APX26157.1 hypothetical protein Ga0080559_TMP181 [Salipiger profundus]GGA23493.1 hypothetical protein GCM10011326_39860 [Salipiger profundus]